jgi:predicted rRNA methylase YqxC with S4 and FtsJ domains
MSERRGWFIIPGVQTGDRTVKQQMLGLGPLVEQVKGKRVVDFGCAEGLVEKALLDHGAHSVLGFEVVAGHVPVAERVCADYRQEPCRAEFRVQDLNVTGDVKGDGTAWDVALMLAVLHKLRMPHVFLDHAVREFRPQLLVIRTAGATPGYVKDQRGKNHRVDLIPFLAERGYTLREHLPGPFDEWTGYFVTGASQ